MKLVKLIAVVFMLTVSCKKEQKNIETVVVDTIEKADKNGEIDVSKLITSTFKIEGMTCAMGCAAKIEKSLSKIEGVASAKVNFETKIATVSYNSDKVTKELLIAKVTSNGGQYKIDFSKSCATKKCDVKCTPDCKVADCKKCATKKVACKKKCDAKKQECTKGKKGHCSKNVKKCDVKCTPDCKVADCKKCATKKEACKKKCDAKKSDKKACCTKK